MTRTPTLYGCFVVLCLLGACGEAKVAGSDASIVDTGIPDGESTDDASPGASLSVDKDSHDFGAVNSGSVSSATSFTVGNAGPEATGALGVEISGDDAGQFTVVSDACDGATLAASAECIVEIAFAPTSTGAMTATLSVSGDPGGTVVSALSGTGQAAAALAIDPATHDFGGVLVGANSDPYTLTITNDGDETTGTLGITVVSGFPDTFVITDQNCVSQTLAGGASCTVTLQFEPDTSGVKSATLQVYASPGGTVSATLSGTGEGPAELSGNLSTHDFGDNEVSVTSGAITWTVTNIGADPTGTLAFSNSNATDFPATHDCTGTLAGAESCSVSVSFAPGSGGDKEALLSVSASPGGEATLSLSGAGLYRLTVGSTGTGLVTSTPSGVDCGSDCSALFAADTVVTLHASTSNGSDAFFSGWSGDGCSGPLRDCQVTMDQSRTLNATFSAMTHNLIFVSADPVATNLGGHEPYDALCNTFATDAGINNGTNDGYVAMISSTSSNAIDRLGSARGWTRMDGLAFADSQTDLFTDDEVFNPIRFDQNGMSYGNLLAATGTNPDGTLRSSQYCSNWTDGPSTTVMAGHSLGGPELWVTGTATSCSVTVHLICMGTTKTAALTPDVVSGKLVYTTNTPFLLGGGAPDDKCDGDKPVGVGTVRALVAYTTAPASDVLVTNQDYVRLDGQLVGTGAQIIAGQPMTGIWQRGDGSYGPGRVWTGHTDLTNVGSAESTCNDWASTASASGRQGLTQTVRDWFWSFTTRTCSETGPSAGYLYCVEQ